MNYKSLATSCAVIVVGLAVLGAGGPVPTVPSPEPSISAHRALYKLALDSAANGSVVTGAEGRMFFEWTDTCNGWAIDQRIDMSFSHAEGEGSSTTSTFTTWEAKDGTSYRYNIRRLVNGVPDEVLRGSATLPGKGKAGKANYTMPEATEVVLPEGTLFPTAHTLQLLQAAQSGKPMYTATIFDGDEGNGLSEISAVIGPSRAQTPEMVKSGVAGTNQHWWPMRMAFFPGESKNPEPEYEMSTVMLPNGVTDSMLLDYGDFKIKATLEKVEFLPKPDC